MKQGDKLLKRGTHEQFTYICAWGDDSSVVQDHKGELSVQYNENLYRDWDRILIQRAGELARKALNFITSKFK